MFDAVDKAYRALSGDKRINVWHISLFFAFLHLWKQNGSHNPFPITRNRVMELAHIRSIATYHKCVKELQEFGYIEYIPDYDPYLGSRIAILLFERK